MDKLAWYYALNGLNILLLIGRVLKLMDFQPRLGVVTRSLALAGPDLIHFCLVCGMVFVGYAMMGHLILGPYIQVGSDAVGCAQDAQAGGVCWAVSHDGAHLAGTPLCRSALGRGDAPTGWSAGTQTQRPA